MSKVTQAEFDELIDKNPHTNQVDYQRMSMKIQFRILKALEKMTEPTIAAHPSMTTAEESLPPGKKPKKLKE